MIFHRSGLVVGMFIAALISTLSTLPISAAAQTKVSQLKTEPERVDVDKADIDRSQIIGNRELPKVLYIVPWKKPLPGDLSGRPLESVLDEALAPVDRDVFRRQVNYQEQTQKQDAAKAVSQSSKSGTATTLPTASQSSTNK